jgi:uncharacterized protein (TIGR02996 family)
VVASLARAQAALRGETPVDALHALLEAWAETPESAIAELVDRASAIVRTSLPEVRGRTKRAIAAWSARGRAPTPEDVPALLDALADVRWRDAHARLAMIRTWRPDPRVDHALVRLLDALPYRSASRPFYVALIDLVSRTRDPALVERIATTRASLAQVMSPTLGAWLERRIDELLDELRSAMAKAPKPAKPSAVARELHVTLTNLARGRDPNAKLEELLDAIYERPDDVDLRLVYADALLERGDPRGELITLQCQPQPTPAQSRRANALVKLHGLAWLGALAPVLASGWRFERGFLADARVDSNSTRIGAVVGHPSWSTVHSLADSAQIALHPIMRSLRTLVFRPNRARPRRTRHRLARATRRSAASDREAAVHRSRSERGSRGSGRAPRWLPSPPGAAPALRRWSRMHVRRPAVARSDLRPHRDPRLHVR